MQLPLTEIATTSVNRLWTVKPDGYTLSAKALQKHWPEPLSQFGSLPPRVRTGSENRVNQLSAIGKQALWEVEDAVRQHKSYQARCHAQASSAGLRAKWRNFRNCRKIEFVGKAMEKGTRYGSAVVKGLAERFGVSERTIRNWNVQYKRWKDAILYRRGQKQDADKSVYEWAVDRYKAGLSSVETMWNTIRYNKRRKDLEERHEARKLRRGSHFEVSQEDKFVGEGVCGLRQVGNVRGVFQLFGDGVSRFHGLHGWLEHFSGGFGAECKVRTQKPLMPGMVRLSRLCWTLGGMRFSCPGCVSS